MSQFYQAHVHHIRHLEHRLGTFGLLGLRHLGYFKLLEVFKRVVKDTWVEYCALRLFVVYAETQVTLHELIACDYFKSVSLLGFCQLRHFQRLVEFVSLVKLRMGADPSHRNRLKLFLVKL